jgi:hypothetical protein
MKWHVWEDRRHAIWSKDLEGLTPRVDEEFSISQAPLCILHRRINLAITGHQNQILK